MERKSAIEVYSDGSCEPVNPFGNMGWGFIIKKDGINIASDTGYEPEGPETSSNVAEYMGLHDALIWLIKNGLSKERIIFHLDSRLVVNQMSGYWRINGGFYKQSAIVCRELLKEWFTNYRFKWIPRHLNQEADNLSKACQEKLTNWK